MGPRPAVLGVAGAGRPGVGAAARADRVDRTWNRLPDRRGVDRRLPRPTGQGARAAASATTPGSPVSRAKAATGWSTPTAPRSRSPCTWSTLEGNESRVEARAVIDASGTWRRPNPAGADGLPALGERAAADLISYRVPNRAQPDRYAGKHTVVVGAGDSAFNAIHELVQIAADHPGTRITWAIRRPVNAGTFGGGAADQLPERGALGQRAKTCCPVRFRRPGDRLPDRADPPRGKPGGPGGRGRPGAPRRRLRRGPDRVPPGPVLPDGDPARPRPDPGGTAADRGRDRPEHPLLRFGAGHRRRRPRPTRARPVPGRA